MTIETLSASRSHGGTQGVYRHDSTTAGCPMTFSVFVPDCPGVAKLPVVWYLSGLTCTHANATEKGEYRRTCAELGLIFVVPDVSPRGEGVADDPSYDLGQGAGFYVDATEQPWAPNYRMRSYIEDELPQLVAAEFPADMARQAIMGHSMGGHGALTIALRNPNRFRSVSALAPIVAPSRTSLGEKLLTAYLGPDRSAWRQYDAFALLEDGAALKDLLVDQGDADEFLKDLRPELLRQAWQSNPDKLVLRMQPGYDHSYYFISTFMAEHLRWHAERL